MRTTNSIEECIEIQNHVEAMAKDIDYPKGLYKSKVALIIMYSSFGKYEEALNLINEITDECLKLDDPIYITQLLLIKADCFSVLGFYKESKITLNEAKFYAEKIQSTKAYHNALGRLYSGMAFYYEATTNSHSDSIQFYLRSSCREFSKLKPSVESNISFLMTSSRLGLFYFEKKQYDSAQKYLPYIDRIANEYKDKYKSLRLASCVSQASLHYIKKEYQESLTAYQKALILSNSLKLPYYQKPIYSGIAEVYAKLKDWRQENFYLRKYAEITDSLSQVEKKGTRKPLEHIFIEQSKEKNKNIWYTLLAVLIASVITGYLLYKLLKRRSSIDFTANSLNEGMDVQEDEPSSDSRKKDKEFNELIELAKQNSPSLYVKFKEFDPYFSQKLLYIAPDLLASELELCIYMKLNFDTKEIARYSNVSVKSVQGKKYRIRKKMNISFQEDLNIWMSNL